MGVMIYGLGEIFNRQMSLKTMDTFSQHDVTEMFKWLRIITFAFLDPFKTMYLDIILRLFYKHVCFVFTD